MTEQPVERAVEQAVELVPPGRSLRVQDAVADLWNVMADGEDYGLLPELSLDAVMARAERGEVVAAAPRLLELVVSETEAIDDAAAVIAFLGDGEWTATQRGAIEETLDAWWLEALMTEPTDHRAPYTAAAVLGILVGYGAPMVRWLEAWLAELDGPGAQHLASMVIEGIGSSAWQHPAWADKIDEAAQVLAWAKTETVLHGVVMIGGTHLQDGVLGELLDRLI